MPTTSARPADPHPLVALEKVVRAALEEIEARFFCGQLTATPSAMVLFDALRTKLISDAAEHHRYRPRLKRDDGENVYLLHVPHSRLGKHREVMLASYLLRAHADYVLTSRIRDPAERNRMARDFADRIMFGGREKFLRDLSSFDSLEHLHELDVPLCLVAGYIAKLSPGASLVALYGLITHHDLPKALPFIEGTRVGQAHPQIEYIDLMTDLKLIDVLSSTPQHAYVCDEEEDLEVLVVKSEVLRISDVNNDPLVSVHRTVIWSNLLAQQGFLFRPLGTEGFPSQH